MGVPCGGLNFTHLSVDDVRSTARLWLDPLWLFCDQGKERAGFFLPFFDKLAGNAVFREGISRGESESEVRSAWINALTEFRQRRAQYLIYPDE
jgi:hypothetical protein